MVIAMLGATGALNPRNAMAATSPTRPKKKAPPKNTVPSTKKQAPPSTTLTKANPGTSGVEAADREAVKATIRANAAAYRSENIDAAMQTIDPLSPGFAQTRDISEQLFERYDIRVTIESVEVQSITENVAIVRVVQRTERVGGATDFNDNRLTADWELHKSKSGWKIWGQVNINVEKL